MTWRPMKTGNPKGEDTVTLFDGYSVLPGFWDTIEKRWRSCETQGLTGGVMRPTHWMPLPDPPTERD